MNDDELRAIAEASRVVTALAHEVGCSEVWDVSTLPSEVTEHFATFDPPRVLGLLDRVQTAEAERDDLRDLMCRQNLMAATTEMRAEQAEAELNALRAAVEALADDAESNPSARYIHPSRVRALIAAPRRHYLRGDDCTCGFAAGLGKTCKCAALTTPADQIGHALRRQSPIPDARVSGGQISGPVCTDPDCAIPRKPGFPMHGPHDFRAGRPDQSDTAAGGGDR